MRALDNCGLLALHRLRRWCEPKAVEGSEKKDCTVLDYPMCTINLCFVHVFTDYFPLLVIICLHLLFQCANSELAKMENRNGFIPCVFWDLTPCNFSFCVLRHLKKPDGQTATPSLPSHFLNLSKVFLPLCHQQKQDESELGRLSPRELLATDHLCEASQFLEGNLSPGELFVLTGIWLFTVIYQLFSSVSLTN